MKNLAVRTHAASAWFLILLICLLSAALLPLTAQSSSPRVPLVSDWTHHHVLYRDSAKFGRNQAFRADPRRIHSWYAHHSDSMWPQFHPRFHPRRTALPSVGNRDWTVPLGASNFAPTYDGTFSFSLCCVQASSPDTGFGNISAINLGNGSMLATQGSITLTATADGLYTGTLALYPGGPSPAWTTDGSQFDYDNLVYPGTSSHLDCNGLLFGNHGLYEANLRRYTNFPPSCPNNANYEYEGYNGNGYFEDNTGSPFALTMSSSPNPGGGQTFPAKYVFNVATVPSCASDFVVIGIPALPTVNGQANIVGFNNLYTTPTGAGYCGGSAPTVMFAYASGTGMVPASVTLSMSGQQIAYVENLAGSSYLHVLTIGTTGFNGVSATSSVLPAVSAATTPSIKGSFSRLTAALPVRVPLAQFSSTTPTVPRTSPRIQLLATPVISSRSPTSSTQPAPQPSSGASPSTRFPPALFTMQPQPKSFSLTATAASTTSPPPAVLRRLCMAQSLHWEQRRRIPS